MGDLKLQGHSNLNFTEVQPNQRKIKDGVSLEQVKQASDNNNLDEIVVETTKGERYITYADELSVKGGNLPKVGDQVNLSFVDEAVKVVHVDDESNEDLTYLAVGGPIVWHLGVKKLNPGDLGGDDAKILAISTPLGKPTAKELSWANETLTVRGNEPLPSKFEIKQSYAILNRQKQSDALEKIGGAIAAGGIGAALAAGLKGALQKPATPHPEEKH